MIETGPRGNPSWREKAGQTEHGPAEAVPGRQCWVDFVELESLLVNFDKKITSMMILNKWLCTLLYRVLTAVTKETE